jgi:hypothetical protein
MIAIAWTIEIVGGLVTESNLRKSILFIISVVPTSGGGSGVDCEGDVKV